MTEDSGKAETTVSPDATQEDDPGDGTLILATQGSVTFVGSILGRAVGFGYLLAVTRLVDASTFGIYSLGVTVVMFLRGFAQLNLDRAIDYFVPQRLSDGDPEGARAVLFDSFVFAMVGTVVVAAGLAVTAGPVAEVFQKPRLGFALPWLALLIPLTAAHRINVGLIKAVKTLQYKLYVDDLVRPAVKLAGTVALLLTGAGLSGLIAGHLLAIAAAIAVGWVLLSRRLSWLHIGRGAGGTVSRSELLRYSLPLAFAGMIYMTVWQIDYFVIGFFLPSSAVAQYRVAFQLTANLVIAMAALAPIYKPLIAERVNKPGQLAALYRTAARWAIMLTLPLAITLGLAPGAYLALLFTPEYATAGTAVLILSVGYLANAAGGPEGMMLEGLGHTRLSLVNAIFLVLINGLLDVLLVPMLGITGAAVGSAVALSARVALGVAEIRYLHGFLPYDSNVIRVGIAGGIAALAGYQLTVAVKPGWVIAVSLPFVVTVTYLIALVAGRAFSSEDYPVARAVDERVGRAVLTRLIPEE